MNMNTISVATRRKLRARRDARTFQNALRTASPSMQHELLLMAQHQNVMS